MVLVEFDRGEDYSALPSLPWRCYYVRTLRKPQIYDWRLPTGASHPRTSSL